MSTSRLSEIIEILKEMTDDWDTGLDGGIEAGSKLVSDLGFESIDVVYLVTAIEERYDKSDFPFEDLLMEEGRYIEDLTVAAIADFVARHL